MQSPTKSLVHAWDLWTGLLLAIAGPLLAWFGMRNVPLAFLLLGTTVWLAALAILWRRPILKLLGPLFLYEIIRETRRSRYFLLRLYCYLILIILFVTALIWSVTGTSLSLSVKDGTAIAQTIAVLLLMAHLLLVTAIVPVYVGSAVAEDKERRTLEFLMATELGSNEILLGKLGVRLANLLLMLLTGLPVLALLQLVGGLDADLVLSGFVATLACTFSMACVALYNSVLARRTRAAILRTYFALAGYLMGSWIFSAVLGAILRYVLYGTASASALFPYVTSTSRRTIPPQQLWVTDLLEYLDLVNAGNPFMIESLMNGQLGLGKTPSQAFALVSLQFIGFHLIVGLFFLAAAMLSFRKVFKQEQEVVQPKKLEGKARASRTIGAYPLLWKELWFESGGKAGCLRRLLTAAVVLASLFPAWLSDLFRGAEGNFYAQVHYDMARDFANYACTVAGLILSFFLFRIAIHASSTFSRERERQTLDSLLTCPVTPRELLAAKWGGTMLSIRYAWIWLAGICLIGWAQGNVPFFTFACFGLVWVIYAGAIACLGQFFSLICSTSMRAMMCMMVTLAVIFAGMIGLAMESNNSSISPGRENSVREWLFRFQVSLSPGFVFGRLIPATTAADAIRGPSAERWEGPMVVVSAATWLVAGLLLWRRNATLLRRQMCPERGKEVQASA